MKDQNLAELKKAKDKISALRSSLKSSRAAQLQTLNDIITLCQQNQMHGENYTTILQKALTKQEKLMKKQSTLLSSKQSLINGSLLAQSSPPKKAKKMQHSSGKLSH